MRTVLVLSMLTCLFILGCSEQASTRIRIIEPTYSFVNQSPQPVASFHSAKLAENTLHKQTVEP
jgi:hypothetical protein